MYNKRQCLLILILATLTGCSSASGGSITLGSVLVNFSNSFPAIWQLLTATAYILGFSYAFKAIFYLKVYGESRSMMSSQGSIKVPLIYLLVAVALIFIPTTFSVLTTTAFGSTNPLAFQIQESTSNLTLQALLYFVQIVGLISFIRGWVQLANSAQPGSQHSPFGRALTHIAGGIVAMNIGTTISIMQNTFGLGV